MTAPRDFDMDEYEFVCCRKDLIPPVEQPDTCEHSKTGPHEHISSTGLRRTCPEPVPTGQDGEK